MEKQTSIQRLPSSRASNGTNTQLGDLRIDFKPLLGAYPSICYRSISFWKRLQGLVNSAGEYKTHRFPAKPMRSQRVSRVMGASEAQNLWFCKYETAYLFQYGLTHSRKVY